MHYYTYSGPGITNKQFEKLKPIPLKNFSTLKKTFCYTRDAGKYLADIYTLTNETLSLFCGMLEWNPEEIMEKQANLTTKNYILYRFTKREKEESKKLIQIIDACIDEKKCEDKKISLKTVLAKTGCTYTQLREKIINFRTVFDVDDTITKNLIIRKGKRDSDEEKEAELVGQTNEDEDEDVGLGEIDGQLDMNLM
jgi:hypothetical protein